MKLNIRERIYVIGLIISVIVFFIINAVSYWSTRKHIESRTEIETTLETIYELENLISMIKDAETGQRGFIITGDWAFLEPYYIGVTAVHKSMTLLKVMNEDEAQILQRLDIILGMIERRFDQFYKAIRLRKDGDVSAAVLYFTAVENQNIMSGIRKLIEELKLEKNSQLQKLIGISKKRSQYTIITIVIGNLFAFLFVFFSLSQLYRDIMERVAAEKELRVSREQLRSLARRLENIREEERILISREIHDVMGGGLTGLKMDLARLFKNIVKAGSDKEREAIKAQIAALDDMADQMISVTRRISSDLRPPVLDDFGLIPAMEWQLSEFTARTGILHKFKTTFVNVIFKNEQAVAMFRIFQEALTNVVRHSGATEIEVVMREEERNLFMNRSFVLEISDDGRGIKEDERDLFMNRNVVLEISDNGRGITEDEILNSKSLGLLGMKERALAFGGELSISGKPGKGTVISIKMPGNLKGENNDQGNNS
jgi:signal transduction histidine kinase